MHFFFRGADFFPLPFCLTASWFVVGILARLPHADRGGGFCFFAGGASDSASGLSSSNWAVPWVVADEWIDPVGLTGKQGAGMLPESPSVGIGVVAVDWDE